MNYYTRTRRVSTVSLIKYHVYTTNTRYQVPRCARKHLAPIASVRIRSVYTGSPRFTQTQYIIEYMTQYLAHTACMQATATGNVALAKIP
jgi:hypothetical protein